MIGRTWHALEAVAVVALAVCGAGLEVIQHAAERVQARYEGP